MVLFCRGFKICSILETSVLRYPPSFDKFCIRVVFVVLSKNKTPHQKYRALRHTRPKPRILSPWGEGSTLFPLTDPHFVFFLDPNRFFLAAGVIFSCHFNIFFSSFYVCFFGLILFWSLKEPQKKFGLSAWRRGHAGWGEGAFVLLAERRLTQHPSPLRGC